MKMIENKLNFKVQYADTDAYGVVWHGNYLRWMEQGRVELLEQYGVKIEEYQMDKNIVFPVVELDIKYKYSAKLMNEIILTTTVKEITSYSITFVQEIHLKNEGTLCTTAVVKAVAIQNGKIIRTMGEIMKDKV